MWVVCEIVMSLDLRSSVVLLLVYMTSCYRYQLCKHTDMSKIHTAVNWSILVAVNIVTFWWQGLCMLSIIDVASCGTSAVYPKGKVTRLCSQQMKIISMKYITNVVKVPYSCGVQTLLSLVVEPVIGYTTVSLSHIANTCLYRPKCKDQDEAIRPGPQFARLRHRKIVQQVLPVCKQ